MSGALLIAGTTSDAGKSMVVAGLCRLLARKGIRGRAVQGAEHVQQLGGHRRRRRDRPGPGDAGARRGLAPSVRFNPVLLKPGSDRTSQLVVRGRVVGTVGAGDYIDAPRRGWPRWSPTNWPRCEPNSTS